MTHKYFMRLSAFLLVLFSGQVAEAEILYGMRGSYGNGTPADLITIDTGSGGLVREIGITGLTGVGGFAINQADGMFYAVGGGSGTPGLHAIDPTTGAATPIGGDVTASDMGFDSNGILYAVMSNHGPGTWGELATIDLATGEFNPIGGGFIGGVGLAFDSSDTLYVKVFGNLHTVDPLTGQILTTLELDNPFLSNTLTFDENDVLYSSASAVICTIDLDTGTVTELPEKIPFIDGLVTVSGLDFGPVPEPSTLVLWTVFGVIGLAISSWRRRR